MIFSVNEDGTVYMESNTFVTAISKPWEPRPGVGAMAHGYAMRSGEIFTFNRPEEVEVIGPCVSDADNGNLDDDGFLIRWMNLEMCIHRYNLGPVRRT